MKTVSFKKGIEALGYEVKKINRGFNFRSAFAEDANGQLFYFSIEDLRDDEPGIMYRTASSMTDYTGGTNQWDFKDKLAELGLVVKEKRSKGDYNSL